MQGEPIQFGAVAASRAKRSSAGFALPLRSARNVSSDTKNAILLDEAFADFTRIDVATRPSESTNQSGPQNVPSVAQTLMASIAMQLETIDSQRRQLARLLECVHTDATI